MIQDDFFSALSSAEKAVVLTGAGVSTLAGIPDFRGKNGIYNQSTLHMGYPVEEIFDIDLFTAHPEVFYSYAKDHIYTMTDHTPSLIHTVLAQLEARGIIKALYTQNIDLLHTKAGSKAPGELHGSLQDHRCLDCGKIHTLQEIRNTIDSGAVPRCKCGGLIKPEVVFFGEELPAKLLEKAFCDMRDADFLLVLGSSLTVAPVSSLPWHFVMHCGNLAIVNEQPTEIDRRAKWKFCDLQEFALRTQQFFQLD